MMRLNERTILSRMAGFAVAATTVFAAGAQSEVHGRGWKPLPPTSHVVVTVLKGFNGKPLANAAVVFHAVRNGKNDGNLEVKTDEEGKAAIDVIEIGSHLTVQVIANGFATSATEMDVNKPDEALEVKMLRPRAQVSVYQDNDNKPATEKPGIQEPPPGLNQKPAAPGTSPADPTKPTAVPPSGAPPTMAALELPEGPFQQVQTPAPPAPADPAMVTPALESPTVSKDPAATVITAAPRMTARPSATPLAAPVTSTAPAVKSLTTPAVEAPTAGPRRTLTPSVVPGTASPLSVTAPVVRPLTTPQVVTAPTVTQRSGPRPAAAGAGGDATAISVTQRSGPRPSATPAAATEFLPPPPVTAPDAAAPAAVALPKAATPVDATAPATTTTPPPVGIWL